MRTSCVPLALLLVTHTEPKPSATSCGPCTRMFALTVFVRGSIRITLFCWGKWLLPQETASPQPEPFVTQTAVSSAATPIGWNPRSIRAVDLPVRGSMRTRFPTS